jgi:hypothetical protein
MRRKRNALTGPELLLQTVIQCLESDEPARQAAGLQALLEQGPLRLDVSLQGVHEPSEPAGLIRAELLAFLRGLVRHQGQLLQPISTVGSIAFAGRLGPTGRVELLVDSEHARAVVIQQLMFLLHDVGLANVRECAADDCQRLFVKVYRRQFCSTTCQKRIQMRHKRQRDREEDERHRLARERRRRRGRKGRG